MRKLNISDDELKQLTEKQKKVAFKIAMNWNPLGNQRIFRDIQEDVFNYFLGKKHTLDAIETGIIENELTKSD